MMKITLKSYLAAAVVAFIVFSAQLASAGTILKLSLGDTGPDVEYTGGAGGVYSTVDDLTPGTTGEQNTAVEFVGDLDPFFADILTPTASYTLNGVTALGLASVVGPVPGTGQIGQTMTGGVFELWDASNNLLLAVLIDDSNLSGFTGSTAGAEFSINNGLAYDGSLLPYLDATSVSFSIAMTDINDPAGMTVTPMGPIFGPFPGIGFVQSATVNPFTADADKLVAAEVIIPEPTTVLLLVFGGMWANAFIRRRAA
jgi:hypothetical protein